FLHDGAHFPVLEADGDLQPGALGQTALDGLPRDAAGDGAEHGRDDLPAAAAYRATGHSADDRAAGRADAGLPAIDGDFPDRLHRAQAHHLLALGLVAVVNRRRIATRR